MNVVSWLVSIGLLGTPAQVFNFDSAVTGRIPSGWTIAATQGAPTPKWEVLKDTTAPTPPNVLAHVSTGLGANSPVAILNNADFQNGEISVRFKPVSSRKGRVGGLIWRYRDSGDYYLVRADALENNIVVYKVDRGVRTPLTPKGKPAGVYAVRHDVPSNQWSILKVVFKGPLFSVYFDHRRVLQSYDRTFAGPGKVGLWTQADGVTYFDEFQVTQK